jgi:hypothetical protein
MSNPQFSLRYSNQSSAVYGNVFEQRQIFSNHLTGLESNRPIFLAGQDLLTMLAVEGCFLELSTN